MLRNLYYFIIVNYCSSAFCRNLPKLVIYMLFILLLFNTTVAFMMFMCIAEKIILVLFATKHVKIKSEI